ncbi:branched-chain amino acid ABC transporter permease [Sulfitobacter sp. KE34]|uniref:branched-chain amino acid ABC transporter permease n=1 Tax=unclassified Sulfitobacter TaxID=196795 RepID=UPI0014461634|nr:MULTISPECIES: branched-chain amino acid ABC transporter permease [unclassified Sulfitobacter]NKX40243.1 branched-chain amino acid ABC transporter permease [Rhodobacteraceae bacterium R_SAG2]MDF3351614.1 branched-chain amino acid ABC transporter permease [Sulfitobacter sp. KE12]MDF3355287.1 branched-chain amino acid ABC transporter permease [Sulfitobacter sp. KE27]MDF3358935.1 branched-chain amino acid ABC transporter permease [Sulfitobacter sp. KE33]MDF3366359.1 branched-chain amino acid AB
MNTWKILAGLVLAVGLVVWPFVIENRFLIHIGTMVCMYALLALSMNLMLRIGQLSLAHGALMGIGAYTSALVMMSLGFPFVVGFLLSGIVGGLVSLIIGPILLRIRGVYFVLLTFAFGEIVLLTFIEWVDVFGGVNGIFGVPRAQIFGYVIKDRSLSYLMALAMAAGGFFLLRALYRSEFGAIMETLEDDEELARSLGVNAMSYRLAVFVLSGAMAGFAGGFYASYFTFVSPGEFNFWTAVNLIVINVLGGIASPVGVILGALILVPLPELFRDAVQYQVLFYGLALIVFLKFMPDGLYGLIRKMRGKRNDR